MKLAILLDIPDAALAAAHLTVANMITRGELAAPELAGLFPGNATHSVSLVEEGPHKLSFADVKALAVRQLIKEGYHVPEGIDSAYSHIHLRQALMAAGIPPSSTSLFLYEATSELK